MKDMVQKEPRPDKYFRRAPGQMCQRCGGDNSYRSKGTKYCHRCSYEAAQERAADKRAYIKVLTDRDTVGVFNDCCTIFYASNYVFCGKCGQRLRGRNKK